MTSMTRGPLPPAVYWRRRVVVLGLVVALVVLIGGALRGGTDGSSGDDPDAVAEQVAGQVADEVAGTPEPTARRPGRRAAKRKDPATASPTPTATPLAVPTGPCTEEDILVQPVVERAVAGSPVTIVLELRTRISEACTWSVSPSRLTLKVTSGSDDIWASRECPRSVPTQDVVVRQDVTTTVAVTWNGRRSDEDCRETAWALPGYYYVAAAPLGGEPADAQFRLAAPMPEVVTAPPRPQRDTGRPTRPGKRNPDANPGRED